jgi:hypothetical protein
MPRVSRHVVAKKPLPVDMTRLGATARALRGGIVGKPKLAYASIKQSSN